VLEVVATAFVACLQQQGRENAKNDVLFFNEANEARVDSTFSAAAIPVAPRNKMLVYRECRFQRNNDVSNRQRKGLAVQIANTLQITISWHFIFLACLHSSVFPVCC
jgi:hypothetical protein